MTNREKYPMSLCFRGKNNDLVKHTKRKMVNVSTHHFIII
jgi:hypothetical protein